MMTTASDADAALYTDSLITITRTQAVIRGKTYALTEDTTIEFLNRGGNYLVIAVLLVVGLCGMVIYGGNAVMGSLMTMRDLSGAIETFMVSVLLTAWAWSWLKEMRGLYMIKISFSAHQGVWISSDDEKSQSAQTVRIESSDQDYLRQINRALHEALNR